MTSSIRKVKISTLRSKKPGVQHWVNDGEGEFEKDNPQVEDVSPEQTSYALKITRNSFQDEEGSRRSRSQVTTREDLFQFRVLISDTQDTFIWASDPFYVLSCSKKDAKEWYDAVCENLVGGKSPLVTAPAMPKKKRSHQHSNSGSNIQTPSADKFETETTAMETVAKHKFVSLYVEGVGLLTPVVVEKDVTLSILREEIAKQGVAVPPYYRFVHPFYINGDAKAKNMDIQPATEQQEKIITTKDYESYVVIIPVQGLGAAAAVVNVDSKDSQSQNSSNSQQQQQPMSPSSSKDNWRQFLDLLSNENLVRIFNLNSSEKIGSISLFFEDMCAILGPMETLKIFEDEVWKHTANAFHGILNKDELTKKLSDVDVGSYCVRLSLTQKSSIVLSYVAEDRSIISIPIEMVLGIQPNSTKAFSWKAFNPNSNEDEMFSSLPAYLQLISVVANKPVPNKISEEIPKVPANKERYSESKHQMSISFWFKKLFH